MRMRAGTGVGRDQDAFAAGVEAAASAVGALQGEAPALVLVFTTPRFERPALLAGIRSVTGGALLVGATMSGEIVGGELLGFGGGVAVLALSAGPYRFAAASASHIRGDLDAAGQRLARDARDAAGPSQHAALVLLADALLGDLQQLAQGVYRVTGPRVTLCGGAAGDEQKFVATFVFHDDKVIEEGAVALWIASDQPLPVAMRHGWEPCGVPLMVTRAEGTEIVEIGGRPAASVYEEQLGIEPGALPREHFWGTSILHPFGLIQPDGANVIRTARSKTERGTLMIQGCVPPAGSAVQVMQGSADLLLGAADDVVAAALAGRPDPSVVLVFSCAARATIFGERKPEEARRLQAAAGAVPTFGCHSCGEFARTSGVLATHNATVTALAL
jgi:hypothetical protein